MNAQYFGHLKPGTTCLVALLLTPAYLFSATDEQLVDHPAWDPHDDGGEHEPAEQDSPVRVDVHTVEQRQRCVLDDLEEDDKLKYRQIADTYMRLQRVSRRPLHLYCALVVHIMLIFCKRR